MTTRPITSSRTFVRSRWFRLFQPSWRVRDLSGACAVPQQWSRRAASPARRSNRRTELTQRLRRRGASVRQLRESGSGRELADVSSAIEVIGEFDLVHFVCHGRFNGRETGDAGLILFGQGDVLSVSRLLGQPSSSPAELVVLVACRWTDDATGLWGEWLGFSGALLRIGVRNVVAALWDVETRSTMRSNFR